MDIRTVPKRTTTFITKDSSPRTSSHEDCYHLQLGTLFTWSHTDPSKEYAKACLGFCLILALFALLGFICSAGNWTQDLVHIKQVLISFQETNIPLEISTIDGCPPSPPVTTFLFTLNRTGASWPAHPHSAPLVRWKGLSPKWRQLQGNVFLQLSERLSSRINKPSTPQVTGFLSFFLQIEREN